MDAAGTIDPSRLRSLLLALIAAEPLRSGRDWSTDE
jgi:hypothetical protein